MRKSSGKSAPAVSQAENRVDPRLYRQLIEASFNAILLVNGEGMIVLVNSQTERMFGRKRSELLGQPIELLIPERYRERHLAHRASYLAQPVAREMDGEVELWGLHKDGNEFPVEISLMPLTIDERAFVFAEVRNITKLKSEQDMVSRLAAIVRSSHDAILGKTLEGVITSWNPAAEKLYGYTADEIIGKSAAILTLPGRETETENLLERVRQGEKIEQLETTRLTKDGRMLEVSLNVSPIYTARGQLVGASIITRNISDVKRAEERFRALLETAPDAMVISDHRGRIQLVNQQAEYMFGYTREEMTGQSLELLVPERLRAKHTGHRTAYFSNPKPRPMGAGLELRGLRKDGSEFPIEISLGPMQTGEGTWVTAAVRDITDRKLVEEKLARYADNLRQSNQELEQFAYVASHDLQAPLRNVVSFTQLLDKEYSGSFDDRAREYMDFIVQSGKQMQLLIKDLLAFSRVGRQDSKLVPTDCEQVLQQVESQLKSILQERNVRITHDPLPVVSGAAHEINQLLQNLIGNAIKFQPVDNPRVHVSAMRDGSYWKFSVRDWGIGIKPEYQKKIFQIFQRLHTPGEYEGTGIGLALCQKIVTRHGGRIWVESKPGEGSTFYFTLVPAQK